MAIKPKVYSYLRFSDPKQAAGSSSARQMDYARRWAAEHDLELDDALSMEDHGLSAYHQRHVTRGALGVFLAALEDGRVPMGSVLIVEGLDRLSRAEPILAQAQLAQIINAGVTVVTASDGHVYSRDRLKAQPMDLVYSLLVMIRAHEESDTKSKRVRAAIHRQCQAWAAGTWRGIVRNGKDPHWVEWDGAAFQLVPEREEAVRHAIAMFLAGHGSVKIMRDLHKRGLQITRHGNGAAHLYKLIRNRALVGEKALDVDGQTYRLEGYYPPLMTHAEFDALQVMAGERRRNKGKSEIPGIITGMGITRCGYCGEAMVGQNLMGRARQANGNPQRGHMRLICMGYSKGGGCRVSGSCSVIPVEHALMTYCADRMNLSRLLDAPHAQDTISGRLAIARREVKDTEAKIERITEALLSDDTGESPLAFRRRARELETQLTEQQAQVLALERHLADRQATPPPALSKAWASLKDGVAALDAEARMQARQLVADTFERIVVYHRGITPTETRSWGGTIDILLVVKHGATRILHIDRRTGAWRAGEEVNIPAGGLPAA